MASMLFHKIKLPQEIKANNAHNQDMSFHEIQS